MKKNLKMIRVKSKLDELFKDKIDLSDVKSEEEKENKFYTRAVAALSIAMHGMVDYDLAVKSVTDGYHDMGIDAVYSDSVQKKLWVVQSKWRDKGTGSVSPDESRVFIDGVKRIINLDLTGANEKIKAKQQDIEAAIQDMDYQIEMVYCHTGNQDISDYSYRPIKELLTEVNEDGSMELLIYTEDKLQEVYEFLAKSQSLRV